MLWVIIVDELPLPSKIYNKYIDKITVAFKNNVFIEDGRAVVKAKRTQEREKYLLKGFKDDESDNIILIECPLDILAIEFEEHSTSKDSISTSTKEERDLWIDKTFNIAKRHKIQCCIADHGGTSKWLYIFNLIGLPENHEVEAKKIIAKKLVPKQAIEFIDWTNVGQTLIPVISRPHWKPKYNGTIHKLVEGKLPYEQENSISHLLADFVIVDKPKLNKEDSVIKQIKESIRFKDILDEYKYDLTKNPTMCMLGHQSKGGRCFSYNLLDGLWYCFHCGKGGDLIEFVIQHDNIDFVKARKKLMDRANIKEPVDKPLPEGYLKVSNYRENAELFHQKQPFFFNEAKTFWIWDSELFKYRLVDETDMMNAIDKSLKLSGETINATIKQGYLEAFKRIGREKKPKDAPITWIQFRDKVYDLKNDTTFDVTPEYFFTNPLPHSPSDNENTPIMDKIFEEWVGKVYIQTLYEIIAYCCLCDYPIHRIFCINGSGSNGKSKFLALIRKFVGMHNVTSSSLDLIMSNNFETAKMYRKLVCLMGETNYAEMQKTEMLKKLSGDDVIRYEFKNRDSFDAMNYAKIIISTNSLPTTTDKTIGFYRRWLIIDFPNMFPETRDILKDIPEEEFNNLARKTINNLKKLLSCWTFSNEGTVDDRKKKYEEVSNPIASFIKEECIKDTNTDIPFFEFYDELVTFLKQRGKRVLSKREVGNILANEGYDKHRKNINRADGTMTSWLYINGISLKDKHNIIDNKTDKILDEFMSKID